MLPVAVVPLLVARLEGVLHPVRDVSFGRKERNKIHGIPLGMRLSVNCTERRIPTGMRGVVEDTCSTESCIPIGMQLHCT